MSTEPIKIFEQNYTVTPADISQETNRMTVAGLLQKMLDTSFEHDSHLTREGNFFEPLLTEEETWVVTQYTIEVHDLPKLDDELTITTRVVLANSFFVNRYFTVSNQEGLLIENQSQYVGINLNTRASVRLDVKPLKESGIIDRSQKKRFNKIKVTDDAVVMNETLYEIQKKDIDYNNHVNNTVYIIWCLAVIPEEFKQTHQMTHIDVKYGQEVLPDATVKINTYERVVDNQTTTIHIIENTDINKEACQIQIDWQPR